MKILLTLLGAAALLAPSAIAAGQPGGSAPPVPEPPIMDRSTSLPVGAREAAALARLGPATIINPTEVTVAEARAGVRDHPRDADRWHQLGESLDVAGDGAGAVAAFRRATRLPPNRIGRAFLYRDLAEALERAGDLAGALAAARTSARSWPLSGDGLFCTSSHAVLLARLLVKMHDLDGAAAFWRPLFLADPERPECRLIQEALVFGG